ncbi:proteoglycan 4-like isoform X3 [Zingiber officinale]|nr:proteoglycan 4-like isoform X3 [Zingiber officinale]
MQSHLEDSPLGHRSPGSSKRGKKRSLHMIEADLMHCGNQSIESHSKELMFYDPGPSHETPVVTNHIENHTPFRNFLVPNPSSRAYSAIGTFTIQCASCFKWRIIPTKEKYEQIREKILDEYFVCEHAREWRPAIQCEDPEDISQDGSRVWAIDKPNIAQPPSGWERLLRIRGEGGTKFADVYYAAPSGKKLRSMVEVQRFLVEHPEYARQGVTLSQFSFQAPRPLQENYVRKRPLRLMNSSDGSDLLLQQLLEVEEVNPLSCAATPASSNTVPEKPFPSPPSESEPSTAMPQSEQMKLKDEHATNASFNPLFWTAPHTNKERLVGSPTLPSSVPEKPVFYPNESTPLIYVAPLEPMKLTNEHFAHTSTFNPLTCAATPASPNTFPENPFPSLPSESEPSTAIPQSEQMKQKDEHATNASLGAPTLPSSSLEKPVCYLNESTPLIDVPLSEPTKLTNEHPAHTPPFNPFTWATLPANKELIFGSAPAPLNACCEKPVPFPANEWTLPTSLPPEEIKLKDEHPTNPLFSPLFWVDLPTCKGLTIGAPSSRSITPEEPVSPPNGSTLPVSMKLKDEHLANASSCEL